MKLTHYLTTGLLMASVFIMGLTANVMWGEAARWFVLGVALFLLGLADHHVEAR